MPRPLVGLVAVGLLVAAGCGDDDGGSNNTTEEFCAGFDDFNERFADVQLTDPGAIGDALDALRELEPPEEIADEYDTVLQAFQALSEIDLTDQEAVARVEEELPDAQEASNTLNDFVEEECDGSG
jgi:hypothetical protein